MMWQNASGWLPSLFVGIVFTFFGCAKVYGLVRNVYGGRGAGWAGKLAGQCPPDQCRVPAMNKTFPFVFLAIGLFNLGWFALYIARHV